MQTGKSKRNSSPLSSPKMQLHPCQKLPPQRGQVAIDILNPSIGRECATEATQRAGKPEKNHAKQTLRQNLNKLPPTDVSAACNLHEVDGLASNAKQGARLRPYQLADDPRAQLSEGEQVGAISSLHLPRVFDPRVELQLGFVSYG